MTTHQGHCFCGAVSFEFDDPISDVVTCHCESCRRQCSAPMAAFIGVADGQWRWTGQAASKFASSPGVERAFCGTCGTPLSYRSKGFADMMHFYVAAMENPNAYQPTLNCGHDEKLDWLHLNDGLPVLGGVDYTKA